MTVADTELIRAVETLWRIPAPGPRNLLAHPAFVSLVELCDRLFRCGDAKFAVSAALRALGLPCNLAGAKTPPLLAPNVVAEALARAFQQTKTTRRHLCPLDLAQHVPEIAFGPVRAGRFDGARLAALFDAPRLARSFPRSSLEIDRLAQFHWLVIEETIDVGPDPEGRAIPGLVMDMTRDFGEIDPLEGRFPPAVEQALGFLLLAPLEEWSEYRDLNWRGFTLPWVYTLSDDLFARPQAPPSADSLSLQPWSPPDDQDVELEEPVTLPMSDAAVEGFKSLDQAAWRRYELACASSLFETPVIHFLVRAFLANGMDEVMAHMTAIEAGLALHADHLPKPAGAPHRNLGAMKRVQARMAALLSDPQASRDYQLLFDRRSEFVHGRARVQKVSSSDRVRARSLARRVARTLVDLAPAVSSREQALADLLDRGAPML